MEIKFLGTGTSQGVPVIGCHCNVCKSTNIKDKRLRTSIHLNVNHRSFVVDTGPDFRMQMLREQIENLDAVVFTHEHKDHTAGLDDIRPYYFLQEKDIPIYATQEVQKRLKNAYEYMFYREKYPGVPNVHLQTIDNQPFNIFGVDFIPILVYHYLLPVFGFRIGDFTYITDASYIPPEEIQKIKGSKVIVLNALRKEEHLSHFNLQEAIDHIEAINPEKAYLTHISHQLGAHDEVEEQDLPENIHLAYDGLKIQMK